MRNLEMPNSVPRPTLIKTPLRERSTFQCKSAQKSRRVPSRTFGFDLRDPLKVAQYVAEKETESKKVNVVAPSVSFVETIAENSEQNSTLMGDRACTSKSVHFEENSTTVYFEDSFESISDEKSLNEKSVELSGKKKAIVRSKRNGMRTFGIDLRDPLSVAQYASVKGTKQLLSNKK